MTITRRTTWRFTKRIKQNYISFPIGGIGTGSIGLAGNGQLLDWEIFNRPAKGSANGFTHIMVKAEHKGRVQDVRVLQSDFRGSGIGGETVCIKRGNGGYGYGFGPYRGTMAGVPHFRKSTFVGEFSVCQNSLCGRALSRGSDATCVQPIHSAQ